MTGARWAAVIVAAGRGERFGGPKQLFELGGLPMVGWSMRTFAQMPEVAEIVVATEPEWTREVGDAFARLARGRIARVVEGGATRQDSVRNGLRAVPGSCNAVLVHDGARPLVRADDVRAAMREVRDGRAALLAERAVDTMKRVDPATLRVLETVERATLWAAQTPQFATAADFRRAHAAAERDGVHATDDAALLERIGVEVVVVPATHANFKVTLPEDMARAQALLRGSEAR
ncbi:MAG: 2-C-methyl-D-erythritol 4-phosphate cytidylyltransferase [Candidatus Eremiobacteraeota bacterium]|nr:2-C-methyl-D-erythritol 4-phosphate cytidylyltransferase [Candidatus Eremiobacteraeota bacterium]